MRAVVRHPQGYGLGNAGVTASRTGVEPKAGESTYTEHRGRHGRARPRRSSPGSSRSSSRSGATLGGASVAAVIALGLQTDVIGVHWLAVVLWAIRGDYASGMAIDPRVDIGHVHLKVADLDRALEF